MLKEFKAFAMRGNLIDMAVAFVMGVAFAAITNSFINGVVMPLIGQIFQVGDLAQAKFVLSEAVLGEDGAVTTPESAVMYGEFIGAVINFIIVAFVMFMVVKGVNSMKKKQEEAPAAPPAPTKEEILLGEIRDLLKK
ncbi:MAG: large-conductance mechanosensitive channel protein MscL [Flavobacteriales bacterium]|nr:large-conductance mechanosensitive channel protein MscL [Flavobacteriales bacterium]